MVEMGCQHKNDKMLHWLQATSHTDGKKRLSLKAKFILHWCFYFNKSAVNCIFYICKISDC